MVIWVQLSTDDMPIDRFCLSCHSVHGLGTEEGINMGKEDEKATSSQPWSGVQSMESTMVNPTSRIRLAVAMVRSNSS